MSRYVVKVTFAINLDYSKIISYRTKLSRPPSVSGFTSLGSQVLRYFSRFPGTEVCKVSCNAPKRSPGFSVDLLIFGSPWPQVLRSLSRPFGTQVPCRRTDSGTNPVKESFYNKKRFSIFNISDFHSSKCGDSLFSPCQVLHNLPAELLLQGFPGGSFLVDLSHFSQQVSFG